MKKTMALLAITSLVVVGCSERDMNEPSGAAKDQIEQSADAQQDALNQQKKSIEQSADKAQDQISAQAKAEKERIESQAESQQAKIEAEKKQVEAQADAAKADVNAQEKVNEAAGAAPATTATTTEGSETDRNLTTQVRESLTSQNAALTGVTVTAMNGKVTLRGSVKTEAEKEALETQAKAVSGVTSVDNQLEVKAE